jgi:virginiamycin A acetyltransferase
MPGPDPDALRPVPAHSRIAFLKPLAAGRANVSVGEYTYYDDPDGPERFFETQVLHHFDFVGDRLVIGRYCAIAAKATFVMNGANHAMGGFSTYPFNIFGGGWDEGFDPADWTRENRGDTEVGHDVWIGGEAMILPGARIGHGAIIGARAVVSGEVPPYAVVAGNPARILRRRIDDATARALLDIAWWDWPAEKLARHVDAVRGADIDALRRAAEENA